MDIAQDRNTYSSRSHTAFSARGSWVLCWRGLNEVEGLLDLRNTLLLLRHDGRQVLQERLRWWWWKGDGGETGPRGYLKKQRTANDSGCSMVSFSCSAPTHVTAALPASPITLLNILNPVSLGNSRARFATPLGSAMGPCSESKGGCSAACDWLLCGSQKQLRVRSAASIRIRGQSILASLAKKRLDRTEPPFST